MWNEFLCEKENIGIMVIYNNRNDYKFFYDKLKMKEFCDELDAKNITHIKEYVYSNDVKNPIVKEIMEKKGMQVINAIPRVSFFSQSQFMVELISHQTFDVKTKTFSESYFSKLSDGRIMINLIMHKKNGLTISKPSEIIPVYSDKKLMIEWEFAGETFNANLREFAGIWVKIKK